MKKFILLLCAITSLATHAAAPERQERPAEEYMRLDFEIFRIQNRLVNLQAEDQTPEIQEQINNLMARLLRLMDRRDELAELLHGDE